MSEQISPHTINFEQIEHFAVSDDIQRTSLNLADIAMQFAVVERVPRYDLTTRESDVEHSYMLGLIAQEIAGRHFPELDAGLVARFAIVHDLVEIKTGDVATFSISDEALVDKATREKQALEELCHELPPETALLLQTYEEQAVAEARFVRMVDKLMPLLVDILGPGSEVMHEDYDTYTHIQLDDAETAMCQRFEAMFPDPFLAPMHLARTGLARRFKDIFRPVPVQDTLF